MVNYSLNCVSSPLYLAYYLQTRASNSRPLLNGIIVIVTPK